MDIVVGEMVVVVYSKPSGVWSYQSLVSEALTRQTWLGTNLGTSSGRDSLGQSLNGQNEANLVDQVLDILCGGGTGPQLAQLGQQARVLGDMDVGWE